MSSDGVQGRRIDGGLVELDRAKLVWRPSVYALIFDAEGRILLVDNYMNGKKHYPGGGVDVGEKLLDGLRREVWEEPAWKSQSSGCVTATTIFS